NRARHIFAAASVTPPNSYKIVPGRITAAQNSGSPLPLPMRVSSGIDVIDLCGNTRTYNRPSPRMYCVAAIRPASIVWALTQPPSTACKPYSPKTTRWPRVALPFIRPLWFFRCFTRLGISAIGLVLKHALVNPNLNANVALGRLGFHKTVVNLRSQGAERDRSGNCFFAAGHFGAAQPAGQLNLDSLGAGFHRLLEHAFHRAAETGPLGELFRNLFCHKVRLQLGSRDFFDLDVDPPAHQVLQLILQLIDLLTLAADDHTRPGRVQDHLHLVAGAFDLDLGDAGKLVFFSYVLSNFVVFEQQAAILLLGGIPAAF